MKGREEQIQGKIEEVRRQQEESLDRREQLLQEMEFVNHLTRREQHDTEARKAVQKEQLEAQVLLSHCANAYANPAGFMQTVESRGIKLLRFPGLESHGKGHGSWKTLEKSWNSKALVLEILISGLNNR